MGDTVKADKTLIARVQQLASESDGKRTIHDLLKQALRERFRDNDEGLLDFAAQASGGVLKTLRQRSYDMPEEWTLFDLPSSIVITSPLGDLIIPNETATAGEVDQWLTEGEQYHGSQHQRFKSRRKAMKSAQLDPSRNYMEQLKELRAGDDAE